MTETVVTHPAPPPIRFLPAIAVILLAQLAGTAMARLLGLPLPGPVIGLLLLFVAFATLPRLADLVRPVAQGMLAHLSLLFVPAGVGVIGHLGILGREGWPLATAIVLSTVLAIAVGALVFVGVARVTGADAEPEDLRP